MTLIEQSELRLGTMVLSGEESSLPLEHTDVLAQITGPIASVAVTQRFANPFDHPVELRYLFPLPHDAAVFAFEIRVGSRVITSRVEEIESARRAYDSARQRGVRAGLLEQHRPNLFSLELANVQPHESIVANVRYQQRVRFDDGEYSFVFPMGLTPKYHRDAAEAAGTDAPLAAPGAPIGTVDVQVAIDGGTRIAEATSPSHALSSTRLDEQRMNVRIGGETIPNKDFVLRYAVAESEIGAAAWLSQASGGSTALITAVPPRLEADAEPAPREFVFVIDRSGSMSGAPLRQAKNALRAALRSLGADDMFLIIAFDTAIEWSAPLLQRATQAEITSADAWLDALTARGGTEVLPALEAAMNVPTTKRQRYVVFLTDGAVSSEDAVLALLRRNAANARFFTFGIGPSVNRALLDEMAKSGRGSAEFLQVDEDIEAALIRFQDRIGFPLVQNLAIEWQGARAWDVYPETLPDLYSGQPLEIAARVQLVERDAHVVLSGVRNGAPWRAEIAFPAPSSDPAVSRVWAKARVDALLRQLDGERVAATKRHEVIALAIEHGLLTRFTSLVAVDDAQTSGGEAMRVQVAVPLPEGLVREAFAAPPLARAASSPQAFALYCSVGVPEDQEPHISVARAASGGVGTLRRHAENDDPLRILARTQNASGSWGAGGEEIEATAAALLAFVRRGETTRSGMYRRQLRKALAWLLAAPASGESAVARAIALAEMGDAIGDATLSALRSNVTLPDIPLQVRSADDVRAIALNRATLPRSGEERETYWSAAVI